MPTPAISLKIKKFRRRFGITASRVVVRSHLPWQWIALPICLAVVLIVTMVWLVMQRNEVGAMGHEVDVLRQEIQEQRGELELLRSTAGTGQNAVSIERAAQQQLLFRVRLLERENGVLKEDIRLFERLIPAVGDEATIRVENFRVSPDVGSRYRYRVLLAFEPSKQSPDFRGRLQFVVSFILAGKEQQLQLPDKRASASDYQFEIKHFLRREGVIDIPSGAVLKAVEVRVLQGDTLKSKQSAQL